MNAARSWSPQVAVVLSAGFPVLAQPVVAVVPAAVAWIVAVALCAFTWTMTAPDDRGAKARVFEAVLAALCAAAWWTAFDDALRAPAALLVVVACAALVPGGLASRLRAAAGAAALLLCASIAVWFPVTRILVGTDDVPWLGTPLAAVLRLLGEEASRVGERVSVATAQGVVFVRPTWTLFQVGPLVAVCVGLAIVRSIAGDRRFGAWAASCAIALGYALAIAVLHVTLVLHLETTTPVLSPYVWVGSLLPLVALLPRIRPEPQGAPATARAARALVPCAVVLGIAVAAFSFATAPGVRKPGRIVINEHASNWESTLHPPGTTWFGTRSGYTFYGLGEFLRQRYDVRVNTEPLADAVLRDVDVLMLKTPTAPYSEAEVAAVERFVERGGGLFLVGDHTNVFGTSHFLNQIASRFGLALRHDSQHDAVDHGLTRWEPRRGRVHPAFQHAPYFQFGTGCSLALPWDAELVVGGERQVTERADYSVGNFFFHGQGQLDRHVGVVPQVAGLARGRGRVLVFTDSTVFSNFWMFVPGKPEAMAGMVEWLMRENTIVGWRGGLATLVLTLTALLLAAGFAGRTRGTALAFLVAYPATVIAIGAWHRAAYAECERSRGVEDIAFAAEGTSYFLPRQRLVNTPADGPMHLTLFGMPLRVDLVPREYATIERAIASRPAMLVVLRPTYAIAAESAQRLETYVRDGGRVLFVLDEATADARALIGRFGFDVSADAFEPALVRRLDHDDPEPVLSHPTAFRGVTGGVGILGSAADHVTFAITEFGRGQASVLTLAHELVDGALGSDGSLPTLPVLRTCRVLFWLFARLPRIETPHALGPLPSMEELFGDDPEGQIRRQQQAAAEFVSSPAGADAGAASAPDSTDGAK